jgi:hypothetical protein
MYDALSSSSATRLVVDRKQLQLFAITKPLYEIGSPELMECGAADLARRVVLSTNEQARRNRRLFKACVEAQVEVHTVIRQRDLRKDRAATQRRNAYKASAPSYERKCGRFV